MIKKREKILFKIIVNVKKVVKRRQPVRFFNEPQTSHVNLSVDLLLIIDGLVEKSYRTFIQDLSP